MTKKSKTVNKTKRESVLRKLAARLQPPLGGGRPKRSREERVRASLRGKIQRRCWRLHDLLEDIESIAKDVVEFEQYVRSIKTVPPVEDVLKAIAAFRSNVAIPERPVLPAKEVDEEEIAHRISEALGIE